MLSSSSSDSIEVASVADFKTFEKVIHILYLRKLGLRSTHRRLHTAHGLADYFEFSNKIKKLNSRRFCTRFYGKPKNVTEIIIINYPVNNEINKFMTCRFILLHARLFSHSMFILSSLGAYSLSCLSIHCLSFLMI